MLCGLNLYRLKNKGQWHVATYVKTEYNAMYNRSVHIEPEIIYFASPVFTSVSPFLSSTHS